MHFADLCFYLTYLNIFSWTCFLSERERLCLSDEHDIDEELEDESLDRVSQDSDGGV